MYIPSYKMGRKPCCDKIGLKQGPWTVEEDHKLINFIHNNGIRCWRTVPKLAGLLRCGKSCRLRWINYLRPDLKRGDFTETEENQIIQLHMRLGNKWSKIASNFPGRTDNEIKNYWNTRIVKRLKLLNHNNMSPVKHDETINDAENETVQASRTSSKTQEKSWDKNPEEIEDVVAQSIAVEAQVDDRLSSNYEIEESLTNINYNQEISRNLSLQEDSNNHSASIVESSTFQENSVREWMESVDSILSWDGFINGFEPDFCFLENNYLKSMN